MKRRRTPRAAVTAALVQGRPARCKRCFRVTTDWYGNRVVVTADTPGHLRLLHTYLVQHYPTQLVADWHRPRLEVQL